MGTDTDQPTVYRQRNGRHVSWWTMQDGTRVDIRPERGWRMVRRGAILVTLLPDPPTT